MSAPEKDSKMAGLHAGLCDVMKEMLKGEPVLTKEGEPVYVNGQLLMKPPSAAVLREIREMLKDNGIDEEPTDGSKIMSVAKAARQFDDDEDPFLMPDPFKTTKQSIGTVS